MDKFGRNYRLRVESISGIILDIKPPFSMEFDVVRNILSSANDANIRIYNLSESTRKQIYKDTSTIGIYRSVELQAGYGDSLSTIFKGNIQRCYSTRQGVDFVSNIVGYDGGFAYVIGQVESSFPQETPFSEVLEEIIKTLPKIEPVVVAAGYSEQNLQRGNTYSGNSADLLGQLTKGQFFVDNERAYVLGDHECIKGSIQVITSESGLLSTPIREETILTFDMLFEPRLLIGQLVELKSSTLKNFNGNYKVISLKHRGLISESVCGDAVTSVGLWYGPSSLTVVN